jgi:RNA polymerase-binding transcription factor DksA
MSKYTARRTQLQARHAQLVRRVGKIDGDLRSTHDRDSEERASELENDDVLEGLDTIARAEVGQIRAALERIEAGLYGTCSACGRPIAAERLAAVPTAITCVRCASQS